MLSMKRWIYTALAICLAGALFVGSVHVNAVLAEQAIASTDDPFYFIPLVDGPLETLRSVQTPPLAVPIWFEGGGQ